ncbi:MAG: hypothetical protein CMJ78_18600 [Planctomycetaceae bacterium]|nr:hypothetical protein [Planctomycetaceae bacterium]
MSEDEVQQWSDDDESEWLPEDLEEAYLRALEANEAVEWEIAASEANETVESESEVNASNDAASEAPDVLPFGEQQESATAEASQAHQTVEPSSELTTVEKSAEPRDTDTMATVAAKSVPRVMPQQVIEAALFVGGMPLTIKKLASLFGSEMAADDVERILDELNDNYATEMRPYEIRLAEGGYRLDLRPDFDSVRNRVYGLGPKEVKLSREAVEVLALVAYRQPLTKSEIERLGKDNPGTAIRQLLRRELICIERGKTRKDEIKYHTTPRFLSLFGLGNLDELPQADELNLK